MEKEKIIIYKELNQYKKTNQRQTLTEHILKVYVNSSTGKKYVAKAAAVAFDIYSYQQIITSG